MIIVQADRVAFRGTPGLPPRMAPQNINGNVRQPCPDACILPEALPASPCVRKTFLREITCRVPIALKLRDQSKYAPPVSTYNFVEIQFCSGIVCAFGFHRYLDSFRVLILSKPEIR